MMKDFIGKKVGFVRVEKPYAFRRNYETAAWYQDMLSHTGDFDLIIIRDHLASFDCPEYLVKYYVNAVLPATVTDNYNAPLWGGVPFGKSTSEKGQQTQCHVSALIEQAAADKFCHPRSGLSFYIDRDFLDEVIAFCEERMQEHYKGFPYWYDRYEKTPRSAHNSEISSVGHSGGEVQYWAKYLGEVLRKKEWRFGSFAQYEKTQSTEPPTPIDFDQVRAEKIAEAQKVLSEAQKALTLAEKWCL